MSLGLAIGLMILLAIIGVIIGLVAGFFFTKRYFEKQLRENPPINEKMIRAMFLSMGRKPSEAQIKAVMRSMRNAKIIIGSIEKKHIAVTNKLMSIILKDLLIIAFLIFLGFFLIPITLFIVFTYITQKARSYFWLYASIFFFFNVAIAIFFRDKYFILN